MLNAIIRPAPQGQLGSGVVPSRTAAEVSGPGGGARFFHENGVFELILPLAKVGELAIRDLTQGEAEFALVVDGEDDRDGSSRRRSRRFTEEEDQDEDAGTAPKTDADAADARSHDDACENHCELEEELQVVVHWSRITIQPKAA